MTATMIYCDECGVNEATAECLECVCDLCMDCAYSVQGGYVCFSCYDEKYADEEDSTPDDWKRQLFCTHSYGLLPRGERSAWVTWGADNRYQRCQKCGEMRRAATEEVSV
jgi:hypothetical protein